MKTNILPVLAVCSMAWTCGRDALASTSTNAAAAEIGQYAAAFYFPVEDVDRTWTWGEGFPNMLQYAWQVKATLMEEEYTFGYTKWNPPQDKDLPGSKGEGSLRELLRWGQVDMWKNGRVVKDAFGISAAQWENRIIIQLSEPEFLRAFLAEKPKQVVLESVVNASGKTKKTVDVSYQEHSGAPRLPPEIESLTFEYMRKPGHKMFMVAMGSNGRFAYGYSFGKETPPEASEAATEQCNNERKKKGIRMLPHLYAIDNLVVYEEFHAAMVSVRQHIRKKVVEDPTRKRRTKYRSELEWMVVPANKLPQSCCLAPLPNIQLGIPTNPSVTEHPQMIDSICTSIFPHIGSSITNHIECALSAMYCDKTAKTTVVNLLLFKDAGVAEVIYERQPPNGPLRFILGNRRLLIISTDNPDRQLANWMQAYFEKADFPE